MNTLEIENMRADLCDEMPEFWHPSINRLCDAAIRSQEAGVVVPDAIACLRKAMDDAGAPVELRADLLGYFCNAWNASLPTSGAVKP